MAVAPQEEDHLADLGNDVFERVAPVPPFEPAAMLRLIDLILLPETVQGPSRPRSEMKNAVGVSVREVRDELAQALKTLDPSLFRDKTKELLAKCKKEGSLVTVSRSVDDGIKGEGFNFLLLIRAFVRKLLPRLSQPLSDEFYGKVIAYVNNVLVKRAGLSARLNRLTEPYFSRLSAALLSKDQNAVLVIVTELGEISKDGGEILAMAELEGAVGSSGDANAPQRLLAMTRGMANECLRVADFKPLNEDPLYQIWVIENSSEGSTMRFILMFMGTKAKGAKFAPEEIMDEYEKQTGKRPTRDAVVDALRNFLRAKSGDEFSVILEKSLRPDGNLGNIYSISGENKCEMSKEELALRRWSSEIISKYGLIECPAKLLRTIVKNGPKRITSVEFLARTRGVTDVEDRCGQDIQTHVLDPMRIVRHAIEKEHGPFTIRKIVVPHHHAKRTKGFLLLERKAAVEQWLDEIVHERALILRPILEIMTSFPAETDFNWADLQRLLRERYQISASNKQILGTMQRVGGESGVEGLTKGTLFEVVSSYGDPNDKSNRFKTWRVLA